MNDHFETNRNHIDIDNILGMKEMEKKDANITEVSCASKRNCSTKETTQQQKRIKINSSTTIDVRQNDLSSVDSTMSTISIVWNDCWLEFKETPQLEETKIDQYSSLKWCPNFISSDEGDALFQHLMQELNFEHTAIKLYGKSLNMPRLQSWFAEEDLVVKELYQKQKQHVWTQPMLKLKTQLEKQLGFQFDYCLVNLYRNGDDYIGFHADNEEKRIVASLSLGATRKFLLRHLSCFGKTQTRARKLLTMPEQKEYEFSLSNGSLIVMLGGTQNYWKHAVPKDKTVTTARINLTFRTMRDK